MKLSEMQPGQTFYTQLASTALAVLVRREVDWAVYIAGVPGWNHDSEWQAVAAEGDKARKPIAVAIAKYLFHPGFEIDLPYGH